VRIFVYILFQSKHKDLADNAESSLFHQILDNISNQDITNERMSEVVQEEVKAWLCLDKECKYTALVEFKSNQCMSMQLCSK
jgi:hypothetical protein